MTKEQMLQIAGWFCFFLACLLPIYSEWACKVGPEWLSEETAMMSATFLAILFLWTGGKLMWSGKKKDDDDGIF
jgi:hypothetical protein